MKTRLATLVEHEQGKITGKLGDAVIIIEADGSTKGGLNRWRLMLAAAAPHKPDPGKERQAHNRDQASWRIARRKAEGVEAFGGEE